MQNITTTAGLKNAIQQLEIDQSLNEQLLKIQFQLTRDSLKPVNLLKNMNGKSVSPDMIDDILVPAIGLSTDYLIKKIVVGKSDNKGRKLLGSVLQYSVANYVAQHPDKIKSISNYIFQHIFSAKKNEHLHDQCEFLNTKKL